MSDKNLYRDKIIRIYVTKEEKDKIISIKNKAGVGQLTNYGRRMMLHGFVLQKDFSELREFSAALGKIHYEFNQIGNNINQISKKANETEQFDIEEMEKLQKEFRAFKAHFRKMERELLGDLKAQINKWEDY